MVTVLLSALLLFAAANSVLAVCKGYPLTDGITVIGTSACIKDQEEVSLCTSLGITGAPYELQVGDNIYAQVINPTTNNITWHSPLEVAIPTRDTLTSVKKYLGSVLLVGIHGAAHNISTWGSKGLFCVDTATGVISVTNAGNFSTGSVIWDSKAGWSSDAAGWGFPSSEANPGKGPFAPKPSPSPSPSPPPSPPSDGPSMGMIGGIAGGVAVVVIAGIAFFVSKKKKVANSIDNFDSRGDYRKSMAPGAIYPPEPSVTSGNNRLGLTSINNNNSYNSNNQFSQLSESEGTSTVVGSAAGGTVSSGFVVTAVPSFYRAIRDYEPMEAGELSLQEHARVYITTRPDSDGWVVGNIGGSVGRVHSSNLGLLG
ncbi:UNVERIFIED_CONTAM: hypothetical protein HDU68_012801 [Siphonaria sp. JEL0065]|nr:hypothetical protein HDU68_012801 [Siphonaria sp. JEL0065]